MGRSIGRPPLAGGYSSTQAPQRSERFIPGHWEGDHIKGASNRSQVGTLVERKTRFVALVKLSDGTAQATADGLGAILNRIISKK